MLYHVTHRKNVPSILRDGIQTRYSTGKANRVWLVEYDRLLWAERHVCQRHDWLTQDIVVIGVSEIGFTPLHSGREGLFYSVTDVPTSSLEHRFVIHFVPMDRIQFGRDKDDKGTLETR